MKLQSDKRCDPLLSARWYSVGRKVYVSSGRWSGNRLFRVCPEFVGTDSNNFSSAFSNSEDSGGWSAWQSLHLLARPMKASILSDAEVNPHQALHWQHVNFSHDSDTSDGLPGHCHGKPSEVRSRAFLVFGALSVHTAVMWMCWWWIVHVHITWLLIHVYRQLH